MWTRKFKDLLEVCEEDGTVDVKLRRDELMQIYCALSAMDVYFQTSERCISDDMTKSYNERKSKGLI